jgi:cell wall-associated NlpC family hydrolase
MSFCWHDLLGVPWRLHGRSKSGMDCSTVAEEILARLGHSPPPTSPYRCESSAGDQGEMFSYLDYLKSSYELLGQSSSCATERGDLVLCGDERGIARHLFVLVEPSRGTFLTASHDRGVIAVRRYMLSNVRGVYRIQGAR